MPLPVFCKRVRKLLKTNDRSAKKSAKRGKESARVCGERVYVGETGEGVELT